MRNLWVFRKERILVNTCVNMILAKLYIVYLWDSQHGGGFDAEGVWKHKKGRFLVKIIK